MDLKKKVVKGKIDRTIFIRAKANGMNNADAARLAGSKALTQHGAEIVGYAVMKEDDVKMSVIEMMNKRREQILHHMSEDKMDSASLKDQAIAIGILTEKSQLLQGQPTERADVTFSNKTDDELDQIIEQTAKGVLGEGLIGETAENDAEPAEISQRIPTEETPETDRGDGSIWGW